MPDFSICTNSKCSIAYRCHRHTAKPDPMSQSYQKFYPMEAIDKNFLTITVCDYYKEEPKNTNTQLPVTNPQ